MQRNPERMNKNGFTFYKDCWRYWRDFFNISSFFQIGNGIHLVPLSFVNFLRAHFGESVKTTTVQPRCV